jgi:hypothetical protein
MTNVGENANCTVPEWDANIYRTTKDLTEILCSKVTLRTMSLRSEDGDER